jgi:hypothetical protein
MNLSLQYSRLAQRLNSYTGCSRVAEKHAVTSLGTTTFSDAKESVAPRAALQHQHDAA